MKLPLGILLVIGLACAQRSKPLARNKMETATTDFALNLYKIISKSSDASENIFFSPLSVYTALAMLKEGAKQNTAKELETAMRTRFLSKEYENDVDWLDEIFKPFVKNKTLSIANRVWMQKNFCTSRCDNYLRKLKKKFDAALEQLNFVKDPEGSRMRINKWVAENTNEKIKDLMPAGSINAMTRFVLTNAIYFKSKWANQFDKKATRLENFDAISKSGVTQKRVPMMYQKGEFFSSGYIPSEPYQLVELPYQRSDLSMVVIVPNDLAEMKELEQNTLSTNVVETMLTQLYEYPSTELDLYFPKFEITNDLDLKSYLQTMGMRDMFNTATADLSGIVGYRGMFVSDVKHKAYVKVDEEGTEAAAATGLDIRLASFPFQFKVDKPFLYFIRDIKTGTILFMGRVVDPSAKM